MYALYLDESGNRQIKHAWHQQSDFFVLGGLLIKEEDIFDVEQRFLQAKKDILPKELINVPIHAVALNHITLYKKNNNEDKNKHFAYKEHLTDKQGKEILNKLYDVIKDFPIEAMVVIVDNVEMREKYATPEQPYTYSYEIILEKLHKIMDKRNNQMGVVNLAECSSELSKQLSKLHEKVLKDGTSYVKNYKNIFGSVNIKPMEDHTLFEIADLICYAYQRAYYSWLIDNMEDFKPIEDNYLEQIKPICKLEIGKILINGNITVKILPKPRFSENMFSPVHLVRMKKE